MLEEKTPIEAPEYHDNMYTVRSRNSQPFRVDISVSEKLVPMEVDTGATLSVMPHSTYLSTWGKPEAPELKPSAAKLCIFTGEEIKVIGMIDINVEHEGQQLVHTTVSGC